MKSRITKVILFALIAVLLFGTVSPLAYESYDTYTYSIDGEPLKSPAAYTPAPMTYNSYSMGLLSGNYWGYTDWSYTDGFNPVNPNQNGLIGIWKGSAMSPVKYADKFSADGIEFVDNGDGTYTVAGHTDEYLNGLLAELSALRAELDAQVDANSAEDGIAVTFKPENVDEPEGIALTTSNYINYVKESLAEFIAAAKGTDADAKVKLTVNNTLFETRWLELLDMKYISIPSTYNDKPVIAIAEGAFVGDETTSKIYAKVDAVYIPSSVKTVAGNAFSSTSLTSVFYGGGSSASWNGEQNTKFSSLATTVYYYSKSVKYGNSPLDYANDIVADHDGNLVVVDKTTNRVVILNKYDFKVMGALGDYYDEYGRKQSLNAPTGVFVTDPDLMVDGSNEIFVCDNGNARIVIFDAQTYAYKRTIESPDNPLLHKNDINAFVPYAIAVDKYGRIFVVSHACHQGVIVLSNDGDFTGFIGSQKVNADSISQLWNKLFNKGKNTGAQNLATPFNNITVDDDGFVYVTINFTKQEDLDKQYKNIKSKESAFSPVKKLNSTGVEIMKRNGFFDPGGEVDILLSSEVSKIVDVALGPEGTWTILDTAKSSAGSSRSRTFTYDSNGNLLFAFGDSGEQIGNGEDYLAMTYQVLNKDEADEVYNLVVIDKTKTGIQLVIYNPTEYCEKIIAALRNENDHRYSDTITAWQDVLTSNNNFDLAYIGIGKALFNQGEYDEAMKMLSSAYETEYYAKAFAEKRKDILSVWMIPLIILCIALIVLIAKFLGWAKKINKATALKVGKKTYVEELLYAFHLVFHPFDGFWDLKHEKRGSVRAASTILAITVAAFFYQAIGRGYMFNPRGDYSTVILQVVAVLVPVLLWVVSNWCLTTLFDGEGSLADIYIATCYSLAPLPVMVTLSTILTNVFTVSEGSMVNLLVTIGYIWVALLLFFGMAVTHDYTNGKNFIAILGTIVAMAVIMFIAILFSSLVIKMVTFISSIFTEIASRL